MREGSLQGVKVGLVFTGSHCSMQEVIPQVEAIKAEGAELYAIFSEAVYETNNRFYQVADFKRMIQALVDHPIIHTIPGAEPIGPKKLLDIIVVIPATGNTIAKLANGITDSAATMAIKAHLRNQRPVVIAMATNDALGLNAKNIGLLLNARNIYFVPFRQDDPFLKVTSMIADMTRTIPTIQAALQGRQLQPVILGPVMP